MQYTVGEVVEIKGIALYLAVIEPARNKFIEKLNSVRCKNALLIDLEAKIKRVSAFIGVLEIHLRVAISVIISIFIYSAYIVRALVKY